MGLSGLDKGKKVIQHEEITLSQALRKLQLKTPIKISLLLDQKDKKQIILRNNPFYIIDRVEIFFLFAI
jgi:hypothetical protein